MAGLINSNILTAPKRPAVDSRGYPSPAPNPSPTSVDSRGYPTSRSPNPRDPASGIVPSPIPTKPVAGQPINWDAWASTPWSEGEGNSILPDTGPKPRINMTPDMRAPGRDDPFSPGVPQQTDPMVNNFPTQQWMAAEWFPGENAPPKGELANPGVNETGQAEMNDRLTQTGDPKRQVIVDQLMKYGGLGERDFDQYYQNAWKHSAADINREFGGRGMYGSSDALNALSHSRGDLAAQQSKDEADYAMESWKNDVGRLGLAAQLQGDISGDDLERWGLAQRWAQSAQAAEQDRVRGEGEDTSRINETVFDDVMKSMSALNDADEALVMEWIKAGPGPSTEKANVEAKMSAQGKETVAALGKLGFGGGV